jgi:predicted peptidase
MEQTVPSDIQEHVLQPGNQRYTLALPVGYTGDRPVPLVMALHYGGLVTPYYGNGLLIGLVEPALRGLGAIIVAPDCPTTTTDWTQPQSEAYVLELLDHIQATYAIDVPKTLITGYSMGGIGTWHLAARHQQRFAAALPMAAHPPDTAVDVAWRMPLYVIHSRRDELFPLEPVEAAVGQLKARDVAIELTVLDTITHYETHRFVEPLREAAPWIEEAWQQVSR